MLRIAEYPAPIKVFMLTTTMDELRRCLDLVGDNIDRLVAIVDGIFSMRGDDAPIDAILTITE